MSLSLDPSVYPLIKTGVGAVLLGLWVVLEYLPPRVGTGDTTDLKGFLKTVLIALAGHLTGSGS
jgi:hypothetical protein